jgi:N-acetylmuramoyl-L-alanine amidase
MTDQFWENSPFGVNSIFAPEWEEKQKLERLERLKNGEIIDIIIQEGDYTEKILNKPPVYDNLDPAKYRPPINYEPLIESKTISVTITIAVSVKGLSEGVNITVDQNKQKALKYLSNYLSVFKLDIPKKEGKKKFTITAESTDFNGKTILDKKTIFFTIDTKGRVLESTIFNPYTNINIVIDPGHGYTKGNTGATSKIYTYKIKGNDGKPLKKDDGEFETNTANVLKLPQYVIDDPTTWVVSKKSDSDHTERGLVFDISVKLKDLLDKDGFSCFLTRESKVIQGNDDSSTRKKRIDIANSKKADYFISVHADGADNDISSGAHVIYPKTTEKEVKDASKEFGEDIFKFYNIVQVESNSPREDSRGLQVLGSTNNTKRKVIIELGFVTTPRDSKAMFSNIDKIADQLYQGLLHNIKNNF